jgi:hypothetical protein
MVVTSSCETYGINFQRTAKALYPRRQIKRAYILLQTVRNSVSTVAVAVRPALYNSLTAPAHSQTLGKKNWRHSWNPITQTVTPQQYFSAAFLAIKTKKGGRFTIPTLLKIQDTPFLTVQTKCCELSTIIRGFQTRI